MRQFLQRVGQRADDVDARNRRELAKLLHAELRFARRDHQADRPFLDHDAFFQRDVEALQQLGEIDAARADLGVRDRARGGQRALQGVDRADVRLRRAGAHRDADARAAEGANLRHLAAVSQFFQRLGGQDQQIRAQVFYLRENRLGRVEAQVQPRREPALERRPEFLQHAFQRQGAHDRNAWIAHHARI